MNGLSTTKCVLLDTASSCEEKRNQINLVLKCVTVLCSAVILLQVADDVLCASSVAGKAIPVINLKLALSQAELARSRVPDDAKAALFATSRTRPYDILPRE